MSPEQRKRKQALALEKAKELCNENNCTLLYLTEYGSTLYGTDSENSDMDFKGVFISSFEDIITKKDKDNITFTTGDDESKNSKEDVDLQLYSIHMFFRLIEKGEGSAIEMLYAMQREETTVYFDNYFRFRILSLLEQNILVSKKLNTFTGYCLGQTKKYSIKGERLKELNYMIDLLSKYCTNFGTKRLEEFFGMIEENIHEDKLVFVKFIKELDGSKETEQIYLEVLGRKFLGRVTLQYFVNELIRIQKDYGERAKKAEQGIDKKALSHAYRIVCQLEELVSKGKITYPLQFAESIKKIKYEDMSKDEYQELLECIGNKIDELNFSIEQSELLPDCTDTASLERIILELLRVKK